MKVDGAVLGVKKKCDLGRKEVLDEDGGVVSTITLIDVSSSGDANNDKQLEK